MRTQNTIFSVIAMSLLLPTLSPAQKFVPNYEEAKIPKFTLPDPLVCVDGTKVTDAKTWKNKRRPELIKLFEKHVYGRAPEPPRKGNAGGSSEIALNGKAIRKQITISVERAEKEVKLHLLVYLPAKAKKPVPVFLGLNFMGNHSIHKDPGITLSKAWMRNRKDRGVVNNRATEKARGTSSSRWPIEMILSRGYGLATVYYGDIDPDFDDGFQNGVHSLFYKKGQKPAPDEWGSIATWAWGLSRVMDYLAIDEEIDHKRVALLGHSRLGKTSLWAGARDDRFAIVISNNSGCGGAALSRRAYGETVERINTSFPHWFCDNFNKYNKNENKLPVDQHELIALIAPRPVYVASAVEDQWADPTGEHASCVGAHPVYKLLGTKGLPSMKKPEVNKPVVGTIGYHLRSGKHDVTDFDWKQYLDFADRHYGKK